MRTSETTPVVVGVAQVEQYVDDPAAAEEPLDLMIRATRAAALDAGAPALLTGASAVRVIRGMWPYENPARAVAEAIGNPGAETGVSFWGGTVVHHLLRTSALEIQSGTQRIVILAGAECGDTQAKARRAGVVLQWREAPGSPDPTIGTELRMRHRAEASRGIVNPVQMYPIFENAIRHARGEGLDAHLERISRLWAGFSLVAAENPHAWMREPKGAVQIRTPGPDNRPVSVPYPKLMNSNEKVDQGAALILTSTDVARRLGIPSSKWIFPWVSTEAHDTHAVSHRDSLHTSPGLRIAGNRCLELAGLDVDDIQHMDIYSCFPSAVQVATAELGIDEERPLTVTGGMAFAGGPLNNYAMHGIARMTEVLRGTPGEVGLVTGNGGFLTKHAFCLFASERPARAFRHETPQDRVDAMPTRELAESAAGPVEIESYTVMFGRGGPDIGLAACRLPDGRRAWANTRDAEVLGAMVTEEFCGRQARIDAGGTVVF
ncbi:MAG: hypothetical protein OXP28_07520 [Gammaproteobacteria bacterium]|nr:hypothetical protein [Gammaproteobacteria bacterium]